MQPTNNPNYWTNNRNSYYLARSLICSITWSSSGNSSDLVSFPSFDIPAGNISGTTFAATSTSDSSAPPDYAFQESLDKCGDGYGSYDSRHTWKVSCKPESYSDKSHHRHPAGSHFYGGVVCIYRSPHSRDFPCEIPHLAHHLLHCR